MKAISEETSKSPSIPLSSEKEIERSYQKNQIPARKRERESNRGLLMEEAKGPTGSDISGESWPFNGYGGAISSLDELCSGRISGGLEWSYPAGSGDFESFDPPDSSDTVALMDPKVEAPDTSARSGDAASSSSSDEKPPETP